MTALPSKAAAAKILPADNPAALALYDSVVLPAEKAAMDVTGDADGADDTAGFRAMFARVVGYLLLYPPSDQARAVVLREVEHCRRAGDERGTNEAVYDLGEMYVMDFVLPFYAKTDDRTPRPVPSVSRDSYMRIKEDACRGRASWPRDNCGARPFRCMVTHMMEYDACVRRFTDEEPTARAALTEPCHIFPEVLGKTRPVGRDGATREDYVAARLWRVLERFGYGHLHDALRGDGVHRLENILTLDSTPHAAFRCMVMWLEKAEGKPANSYHIAVSDPKWYGVLGLSGLPHEVRFADATHDGLPLPDPAYLHIHTACRRVATLSGAADYLFWPSTMHRPWTMTGRRSVR